MTRYQAHPDPRRRYLAHRETQPIDRWNERAQLVAFLVGLALILVFVTVILPGAPRP